MRPRLLLRAGTSAARFFAARVTNFRVTPGPFLMVWEATTDCACACRYCSFANRVPREDELPAADVLRIVEDAVQQGLFGMVVTGGEPLLRRDLFAVVERCRELGLFLSLTTNGTRLPSVPDESLRLFDHITVSIDSIDPAEYSARRGAGDLDRAIAGLLHARRHCPQTVIHAQTVVDGENWRRIPVVNRFFHRHGIDTVFQLIDGERVLFDDRVWARTVSQLQFHSRTLAALSRRFLRLFPAVSRHPSPVPCLALTASFVLSARGQMLPCSFRRAPVADLRDQTFTAAWRSLADARRAMVSAERGCGCGSTCFVMPALALRLRAGRGLPP